MKGQDNMNISTEDKMKMRWEMIKVKRGKDSLVVVSNRD